MCTGMVLLRQYGAAATELRLVGGGSRNPLWRQVRSPEKPALL